MALSIYWSKRADQKFDRIIDYLQDKWGKRIARSFVRNTYDFLDILKDFPEIGSIENMEYGIRGYILIKQITVYYIIKGERIILLNFFDNRQNPKQSKF